MRNAATHSVAFVAGVELVAHSSTLWSGHPTLDIEIFLPGGIKTLLNESTVVKEMVWASHWSAAVILAIASQSLAQWGTVTVTTLRMLQRSSGVDALFQDTPAHRCTMWSLAGVDTPLLERATGVLERLPAEQRQEALLNYRPALTAPPSPPLFAPAPTTCGLPHQCYPTSTLPRQIS